MCCHVLDNTVQGGSEVNKATCMAKPGLALGNNTGWTVKSLDWEKYNNLSMYKSTEELDPGSIGWWGCAPFCAARQTPSAQSSAALCEQLQLSARTGTLPHPLDGR